MNEGWSSSRVISLMVMLAILFMGYHILSSLDRQEQRLVVINSKLESAGNNGNSNITLKLEGGLPINVNYPGGMPQQVVMQNGGNQAGVQQFTNNGSMNQQQAGDTGDGKDAIGRPLKMTEGFSVIEPAIGTDLPGWTSARTPDFIPELCGTYNNGQTSEPDKANYYLTNDGLLSRMDNICHDRLFTINPDDPSQLRPALAVAWETSEDNLSFRFHLRKGVEFSDGSPFDADDVMFTWNTMMDRKVEAEHLRGSFDRVESVRKVDNYTIEVRMNEKYWKALKNFGYGLRIIPNEYYERAIPQKAAELGIAVFSTIPGEPGFAEVFNKFTHIMPPGTGPYKWDPETSWKSNTSITMYPNLTAWHRKLNPDFYRIKNIRWKFISDDVTRNEEFRRGGLDVLVVDHNTWHDKLSKDEEINKIANHYIYDHIGLLFSYTLFNMRRAPFDELAVRQAVGHLVNRDFILNELNRGHGTIATCPSKRIYGDYSNDIVPRDYNLATALKILTDAGWKDSDNDGFLDKDGKTLEFNFSVPAGRKFFTQVTTQLQQACEEIGVRCKPDPKEWSLFIKQYYDREFDMVCLYSSAPDPWTDNYDEYHSSQTGPRQGNASGWNNPEVDRLLEDMRGEFDPAKRNAMAHEFNQIFHKEVPQLLLVHGEVGVMLNKKLRGGKVRPTGLRDFDMWIHPDDVRSE